jgi:malate synthase
MKNTQTDAVPGVEILGANDQAFSEILTPDALKFVADLERRFGPRRLELLAARAKYQERLNAGERPDFLPETAEVRNADWTVAPLPSDLLDRRVEITGPVERKMVINALNSGAKVFMADFEDANTPTWSNLVQGQINLRDAIRRTISYEDSQTGKFYKLNKDTAVLIVRPRGWHLPERHVHVDGHPMSGSLFDFGLFIWHNAKEQIAHCSGPYFYLPKLESYLEARLWNDVFVHAEETLGLKRGTIKATVLIETILAAFQMDEILYELREHSAGLNCGRWDYIFSAIKKFANDPSFVMPDRAQVTMKTHFMRSYSKLLIKTCHRREVHAIGGMAAFIPIKNDPVASKTAMDQVRADKEREATDGHDGTWVAHPGLVPLAKEVFDQHMPESNQIKRKLPEVHASAADLLAVPRGEVTPAGLRQNIAVSVGYLESWLRGIGCVPLFNLMEDAATAEISRSQLWQWVHHKTHLNDGRLINYDLCAKTLEEELDRLRVAVGNIPFIAGQYQRAAALLLDLIRSENFVEFLTLPAYDQLKSLDAEPSQKR